MGQAGQRHPQGLDSTQGRHGDLQAVIGWSLATIAALELPEATASTQAVDLAASL